MFITILASNKVRANYFTDHIFGIHKYIYILNNDILTEYDESTGIKINILNNTIITTHDDDINNIIKNNKVLEIGGNIGMNSLVIASILNNDNNFVTLECNVNIANQLI